MNDETEQLLKQLTPHGAPSSVRARLLDAVVAQLPDTPATPNKPPTTSGSHWDRWLAVAIAASVLLAFGLNVWVVRHGQRRLAAIYGPPPVPRYIAEIADTNASVTDAETGRRVRDQLLAAQTPRRVDRQQALRDYEHVLKTVLLVEKELRHASAQENSQVDRDRPRGGGGDTSRYQRYFGLDHRFTA